MISPIRLGLDGAAVSSASPRLVGVVLESSSPETILGHKSNCSESQRLGSPDIAVLNSVLLRAVARRSTPPYGGVLPLTKLTHLSREISRSSSRTTSPSCLSTEIASTTWSSSWPSTVIGSRGGAVAVAAATAGANRGRNLGRKQAPSHGGLTRPAKPHPEGTPTSSCGGGCGGRLRYRTLHYANARVRTPTDHGLSVSIPISGVSA